MKWPEKWLSEKCSDSQRNGSASVCGVSKVSETDVACCLLYRVVRAICSKTAMGEPFVQLSRRGLVTENALRDVRMP